MPSGKALSRSAWGANYARALRDPALAAVAALLLWDATHEHLAAYEEEALSMLGTARYPFLCAMGFRSGQGRFREAWAAAFQEGSVSPTLEDVLGMEEPLPTPLSAARASSRRLALLTLLFRP